MLPIGTLQYAFDTLISGLQSAVLQSQVAGAEINSALINIGNTLFGALGAVPPFPSL